MAGLLALLMALVLAAAPAVAEKRVALVMANAQYRLAPLANPVRDADLVARALSAVGFEVTRATDSSLAAMRRALTGFARKLSGPDTVALFYYAGHGVQLSGQNYLLPVDADVKSAADIRLQGVRLDEILFAMRPSRSRLSIAILDACRDNPFPAASRSLARGLAPVNAPAGTLIAYSTAPGDVAVDGEDSVSPYAAAFAAALDVPGLAIEDVFKRTRLSVMQATGGTQVPWEHSSLTGRFAFRPGDGTARQDGSRKRPELPVAKPVEDAEVLFRDALALEAGQGVGRDLTAARTKLEAAARQGLARADYRLFLYHEEGRGIPRNSEQAADRLLAAYKAGDADAERILTRHYRRLRLATRRAIQRRLSAAGKFSGPADGVFDRRTLSALTAYRG